MTTPGDDPTRRSPRQRGGRLARLTKVLRGADQARPQSAGDSGGGFRVRVTPDDLFTLEAWSPELERLVGVTPNPAEYPKPLERCVEPYHPEDRPWVLERIQRSTRRRHPLSYTARVVHTDGDIRWISVRAEVHEQVNGDVLFIGTTRDTTDDVRAELDRPRLVESATTLEKITSQGLFEHFRTRFTTDDLFILEDCSPGYERLVGARIDLGSYPKPLEAMLLSHHPRRRDAVRDAIERAIAELTPLEYLSRTPTSPKRWLRYRASPERLSNGDTVFRGIVWDVTDQIEGDAERARLTERSKLLDRIADLRLFEYYRYRVTPEGAFINEDWSLGYERLVGAAGLNAPGVEQTFDELLERHAPEFRAMVRAEIEISLETGEAYEFTSQTIAADGSRRWVRYRALPVPLPDGGWIVTGIAHDASREVDAEREREKLRTDLSHARSPLLGLLRASVELRSAETEEDVLAVVADAVHHAGWGSVAVNLFDADWTITHQAYAGMTPERIERLRAARRDPGRRAAMFGPERERFLVGRCYFIPEERRHEIGNVGAGIESARPPGDTDSWRPNDLAYIPVRDASGAIIGRVTIDDPADGQRPTADTLRYFELFADLVGRAIEQGRLQRALEEERAQLARQATVLHRMSDAVFWVREDARFTAVNDRACELTEFPREELLTKTVMELDPNVTPELWVEHWQQLLETKGYVFESSIITRSGKTVPVEILKNLVTEGDSVFNCVFVRDITLRKRAEAELRRSQSLSQQTERVAQVGGWEYDVDAGALYWSDETYRIHDLEPGSPPAIETAIEFYPRGRSRRLIEEAFRRALDEHEPYDLELEVVTASGRRIWVRSQGVPEVIDGQVVRVGGAFQDITQRKHAENILAQQELELRTIFDTAANGIALIDRDGKLLRCNRALLAMLGYSLEELRSIGGLSSITHPDDIRDSARRLLGLIEGKRERAEFEERLIRADGDTIWARFSVSRAVTPDRQPIVVAIIDDVTERRRVREELRRAVEVRGLLLSELDHRVKNALSGLLSMIDLTRERPISKDEFAAAIRDRVQTMVNVHTMLTSSKWRAVKLTDLISGMVPIEPGRRVDADGPLVEIPARQATPLGMVLHELASNSAKHGALTTPEGRVSLRWTVEGHSDDTRLLVLRWTETGGPAPPAKPASGLGLSLVDGFARFELRGLARFSFPPEGVQHTLEISLDPPAAESEAWLDLAPGEPAPATPILGADTAR